MARGALVAYLKARKLYTPARRINFFEYLHSLAACCFVNPTGQKAGSSTLPRAGRSFGSTRSDEDEALVPYGGRPYAEEVPAGSGLLNRLGKYDPPRDRGRPVHHRSNLRHRSNSRHARGYSYTGRGERGESYGSESDSSGGLGRPGSEGGYGSSESEEARLRRRRSARRRRSPSSRRRRPRTPNASSRKVSHLAFLLNSFHLVLCSA